MAVEYTNEYAEYSNDELRLLIDDEDDPDTIEYLESILEERAALRDQHVVDEEREQEQEQEQRRIEEQERVRREQEQERVRQEQRRIEEQERIRLEQEQKQEQERVRLEQERVRLEQERVRLEQEQEQERIRLEQERVRLEQEQEQERIRLEQEQRRIEEQEQEQRRIEEQEQEQERVRQEQRRIEEQKKEAPPALLAPPKRAPLDKKSTPIVMAPSVVPPIQPSMQEEQKKEALPALPAPPKRAPLDKKSMPREMAPSVVPPIQPSMQEEQKKEALPAPPKRAPLDKKSTPIVMAPSVVPSSLNELKRSKMVEYASLTDTELLQRWEMMGLEEDRDTVVRVMQDRQLFPSHAMTEWEYQTGAYPDTIDPEFLQKLLTKREFAESLQMTWKPRHDPCTEESTFEVTPVQRFVSNFLSPKTPYMSALLYHGVGVGKTCAAIQLTETWLEYFPSQPVYLVVPQTIREGFMRTIFDLSRVVIGDGDEPNTASQCTGTTYMKLTGTMYERDRERIQRLVERKIRSRYRMFGYASFANYIESIVSTVPTHLSKEEQDLLKKQLIRREFSGKLLVVDEAHNLRDVSGPGDDVESALAGGRAEKSDAASGKMLTPLLEDILRYSEGMKLCLMTATPMYNTYNEIIFLLNLLLMNDKKATLRETHVFHSNGTIKEEGRVLLSNVARQYISFMRGENPISFPIRLFPEQLPPRPPYPTHHPRGFPLTHQDTTFYTRLPIVPIVLGGEALEVSLHFTEMLSKEGTGINTVDLDRLIHAGNIVMPATEATSDKTDQAYRARIDATSLSTVFESTTRAGEISYRAREEVGAEWLVEGALAEYSPKFEFFLQRARTAEGCVFAYTRFIPGGALPLAFVLEANGYTLVGRQTPLLANGIVAPGGRQCARCDKKEANHRGQRHEFIPACYGILTGNPAISPRNADTIRMQRHADNANGYQMKIIIGSQVASEGVDLRFIRETHVIDAWYHLNKTEQILGRAIRYLSHCALPETKRNNTVYLYAATYPTSIPDRRETADLYSYRIGFEKSQKIGQVTRILKESAVDCNLNRQAIVIDGQPDVEQIDSQGLLRPEVNINDRPFTAVCDWIDSCDYTCKPQISVAELKMDDSTYDEYTARHRIHTIQQTIRRLFSEQGQVSYPVEHFLDMFSRIPRVILTDVLNEIVNNKEFRIRHGDRWGYIRYCNGYYLFQPLAYTDLSIPLAIRAARFPVKRDDYLPLEQDDLPIMEEQHEEKANTRQTVEDAWIAWSEWIHELAEHAVYTPPPNEIEYYRRDLSSGVKEVFRRTGEILEVVKWFHESLHLSGGQGVNKNAWRMALLHYFWDEWMSLEDQHYMLYQTSVDLTEMIQDTRYRLKSVHVDRFIDPETGAIQFMCKEPLTNKVSECPRAILDLIREDKADPLQSTKISTRTTGALYGFITPKNGKIVFKTSEPPTREDKVATGEECGTITTTRGHLDKLERLGNILHQQHLYQFGFDRATLTISSRKVVNANRICTLLDFALRYMDHAHVDHKRWFYRTVEAAYAGHKGKFHKAIMQKKV